MRILTSLARGPRSSWYRHPRTLVTAEQEHTPASPPSWGHKTEAHAGDTVYLQCHDTIRGLVLANAHNADPLNGRIAVSSPLGQAIAGKHCGSAVHLATLDGIVDYRIIKIL